jgi:hypothetical protein
MSNSSTNNDVEKNVSEYTQLNNTTVRNFGWKDVTVTVKDRSTKQPKNILHNINGFVQAGESTCRTCTNNIADDI